jgi:hypothetical protein
MKVEAVSVVTVVCSWNVGTKCHKAAVPTILLVSRANDPLTQPTRGFSRTPLKEFFK